MDCKVALIFWYDLIDHSSCWIEYEQEQGKEKEKN